MGALKKNSHLLFPVLVICMVAAVVLAIFGNGKRTRNSNGGLTVPRAVSSVGIPAARNLPPSNVDATTAASFKLEPYIPFHDTLKKYAYSVFAGQHQVISGVIRQVEKAVVGLSVTEVFGDRTHMRNVGSGLVIDPRGYVLTTADNIAEYVNFKVILFESSQRHQFDGVVESVDPAANLALIRIRSTGTFILPFVTLWDYAPVTVGDWVIACGSIDGLHLTPMQGIVSSTNRSRKTREGRFFYDLIQTDLKIGGAMTGSPVFDVQGKLAGVYIGDGLVQPINETFSPIFGLSGIR